MTEDTMTERVAKAIRAELGLDWPYTGHDELMDTARAAIQAMRPALEAMRDHIVGVTGARPGSDSEEIAGIADAILSEQPLPEWL